MEITVIQNKILEIRGQKVLLDRDLAEMYGVETKRLNEAVRRNIERFRGDDFMFQLAKDEIIEPLRSQIATLKNGRGQHRKYDPFAFTQLGVAMLSSVLSSKVAIETNRNIMRAFVMLQQFAQNYKELDDKLKEMEEKYDRQFTTVTEAINYLLQKDKVEVEYKNRRRIGFVQNET